ncbi:YggT family protein [Fructobacillus sp. M1-13]|uniref:YggT family protein n=1 Tax=Fructobacillus papyriferae TaxID=2713171 RepID=A0ABS5QN55_9LACO|nr:YggT family protein [Fructobacillus papyriferae]MBS9334508.1 YggT family protein [Fructobacillus papyriferae]MCD2158497.1 YggT family protein [Fructobacillus papyriferae]
MIASALIVILAYAIQIYSYALVIYILMSWIPRLYHTWFGRELGKIILPYLKLFSFIKPLGFLDLRPLVALLVLEGIVSYVLPALLAVVA